MNRAFHNMSFRLKILLVSAVTIAFSISIVTFVLTAQTSRYLSEHIHAHLSLLTEQSLLNFQTETDAIERQLISQMMGKMVPNAMYDMRDMTPGDPGYSSKARALSSTISETITVNCGYDSVYVKLKNGQAIANSSSYEDQTFHADADALLSGALGEKSYGVACWTRMPNGRVYVVRDLYNQRPFQYMGKVVARVRENELNDLGTHVENMDCAVAFFTGDGTPITVGGITADGMLEAAAEALHTGAQTLRIGQIYDLFVLQGDGWTAVGMIPQVAITSIRRTVVSTGVLVAFLAMVLGAAGVLIATRRMTQQMDTLVGSMDEVTAGNLDLTVPVYSEDEIGRMAVHFNSMVGRVRELMKQVVQEESNRNHAEYDALEYKYRAMQSQINPHFVYNALQVVNAMGRLSGNSEICQVVTYISEFFRQNTRNMENRFITVAEELRSMDQYAHIFGYIYGDVLSTTFHMQEGTENALIPTMILQPVLENALVYGVQSDHATVTLTTQKTSGDALLLTISDNGTGIPPEILKTMLSDAPVYPAEDGKRASSGIGMRNVRDRLRLIYADRMRFAIESSEALGTKVLITVPLVYSEKDLV